MPLNKIPENMFGFRNGFNSQSWISTNNQSIFTLDNGKYDINKRRIEVFIGGVKQNSGTNFYESSSTTFTLSEPISAGILVEAKWYESIVPAVGGHNQSHKKDGVDELNVADLAGYELLAKKSDVASIISGNNSFATKSDLEDVTTRYNDFATKVDLTTNYATKSDLTTNYATKSDLTTNYATKVDLTTNYATKSDLTTNYATKSDLTTNYAKKTDLSTAISDYDIANATEINVKKYGAIGNGIADDTAAFISAMNACDNQFRLYIPVGVYKITDTIVNKSAGITGAGVDSTVLLFAPTVLTDKKPCLRISSEAYNGNVFENFSVRGITSYNSANLATYVNATLYAQRKYEMFATGAVGIELTVGAKPVFRNIVTRELKIGMHFANDNGHITLYDCTINGLIGIYISRNAWDYFIQGGGINGAFCGILLGCKMFVGYSGGMGATMIRVHMGYGPYGIYQCIDDQANYDAQQYVGGLIGIYTSVRFEQIGEAAICLLPKSRTDGTTFSGFGMSWSIQGSGEDYTIPAAILPDAQKQAYAAYFGYLSNAKFGVLDAGGVFKAGRASAVGSTKIEYFDGGDCDLAGLGEKIDIVIKNPKANMSTSTLAGSLASAMFKTRNPISAGNMVKSPETLSSWESYNGATFEMLGVTSLPDWNGSEPQKMFGNDAMAVKINATQNQNPNVYLNFLDVPTPLATDRTINFEYYIYCPVEKSIRSRIALQDNRYLYDYTFYIQANTWTKISCIDEKAPVSLAYNVQFFDLHAMQPTYIVGVMVAYDTPTPYSPYHNPYSHEPIQSDTGFIVNDTTDGNKYMIKTTNGTLVTKLWDGTGVPGTDLPGTIRMVKGSYVGNGATTGTRTISIPGVTPKYIIIAYYSTTSSYNGTFMIDPSLAPYAAVNGAANSSLQAGMGNMGVTAIAGGFTLNLAMYPILNGNTYTFYYTVFY